VRFCCVPSHLLCFSFMFFLFQTLTCDLVRSLGEREKILYFDGFTFTVMFATRFTFAADNAVSLRSIDLKFDGENLKIGRFKTPILKGHEPMTSSRHSRPH